MAPPKKEMMSRWQRIRNRLADAGLGGLLVFSNQMKPEPVHYLTGYRLLGERAFACLAPEGEPVLFISEPWDERRAGQETGLANIRVLAEDWPQAVSGALKPFEAPVGVAGREAMRHGDLEAVESAIGNKTVSATKLLDELATISSPYELDLVREAGRMADAGFNRAVEVLREGLNDYELVAEIDFAMKSMGATDNFQMLAIGKDNTGMLLPCGKKVEPGDLLLFEITPSNGCTTYTAQLCKTAIFGESPSPLLREKHDLLVEALEESLAVIKPGVKISEIARIQNDIIGRGGYPEYCRPPYMRARGHGFGLGRVDVTDDSTVTFAEGMTLVIHPNQFIPETGYLALGETVIVTADGFERLTTTESKIYECGGKDR